MSPLQGHLPEPGLQLQVGKLRSPSLHASGIRQPINFTTTHEAYGVVAAAAQLGLEKTKASKAPGHFSLAQMGPLQSFGE